VSNSGGGVLARAVVVLEGDDSQLDKIMSDAEKKMKKVGERMSEIGETMTHKITLPLLAAGTLAVHSFGEQEDAMARVRGVIASTGGAAGVTAEHIKTLAENLEKTTTFADEATEAAAAVVLSFTNIRNEAGKGNDVFDRTIKVGQDLSELMGKDLQGAFAALGKTMEDPEQGMMLLRRANVILSPAVKNTIKDLLEQGHVLEAQKMVLDQVEKATGGLAAKMAQTPLGQMKQAWNEVNNALEDVGKQLSILIVLPVASHVKEWATEFRGLNESTQRTVVLMGLIVGSVGPALVVLGTILKVSSLLSVVLSGLANAIGPLIVSFRLAAGGATLFTAGTTSILAPVALAVAAVASLAAGIMVVAQNWTWVKIQIASFITFLLDKFIGTIDKILGVLSDVPGGAGEAFALLRKKMNASWEGILADTGKTLAELQNELDGVGTAAQKAADKTTKPAPRPPAWAAAVSTALMELHKGLALVDKKAEGLGSTFDASGAKAGLYAAAVDAIGKSTIGLDTAMDASGQTLRTMMSVMQQLQNQSVFDELQKSLVLADREARVLGDQFDLTAAKSAAYNTAVGALIQSHQDLSTVVGDSGKTIADFIAEAQRLTTIETVTQDLKKSFSGINDMASVLGANYDKTSAQAQVYEQEVQALIAAHVSLDTVIGDTGMTLEDMIKKMQMLKQAAELHDRLRQVFTDLGDYVVDFCFGAKQSFGDFVRQTLQDITKLIIKMMILNALKDAFNPEKGGLLGGIGKVLGFAEGGFLRPGQVGLVGERGPELLTGGHSGINVTPIPAGVSMSRNDSAAPMVLQFNVNAIDSRGVAQFFEDNEGLVAGAMMRAAQRSSALRRKLGG
jgi:hypothetical protein